MLHTLLCALLSVFFLLACAFVGYVGVQTIQRENAQYNEISKVVAEIYPTLSVSDEAAAIKFIEEFPPTWTLVLVDADAPTPLACNTSPRRAMVHDKRPGRLLEGVGFEKLFKLCKKHQRPMQGKVLFEESTRLAVVTLLESTPWALCVFAPVA